MALDQLILAMNTAGTLAIGAITFFIVYTTFKGIEDEKIQKFSKRFMMAIAVLILYVSYMMMYNTFFPDSVFGKYPLYLILILVFVYMIWAAIGFERIAESYGISQESKLEKMEKEEMG
ncbi:MAG: hypothetical protein ABEI58_01785 [Candidatus Nanohaloarchaea archaeon]